VNVKEGVEERRGGAPHVGDEREKEGQRGLSEGASSKKRNTVVGRIVKQELFIIAKKGENWIKGKMKKKRCIGQRDITAPTRRIVRCGRPVKRNPRKRERRERRTASSDKNTT